MGERRFGATYCENAVAAGVRVRLFEQLSKARATNQLCGGRARRAFYLSIKFECRLTVCAEAQETLDLLRRNVYLSCL